LPLNFKEKSDFQRIENPDTFTEKDKYYTASQWQLVWTKFKKHRLAIVGMVILLILYSTAIFAEFIAPYVPTDRREKFIFAPPQQIRFIDEEGRFHLRPFVYSLIADRDLRTLRRIYTLDTTQRHHLYFFVRGETYRLWGHFETSIKLFGVKEGTLFLMGTDNLGRDLFSRAVIGSQISLSIGLVGVFLGFIIGLIIGGISGYFGGVIDNTIQRVIEFLISVPTLPLWMSLSAAIPKGWPPLQVYFAITLVLSLVGWGGLARVVRGKLLELREEDYIMAAKVAGASEAKIITSHLIPGFISYLIVSMTLSVPGMILGETALSFLGLGLRPPTISWGVLLADAQSLAVIAHSPWMMIPGLLVVLVVLSFNFVGDGLRDAADPYKQRGV